MLGDLAPRHPGLHQRVGPEGVFIPRLPARAGRRPIENSARPVAVTAVTSERKKRRLAPFILKISRSLPAPSRLRLGPYRQLTTFARASSSRYSATSDTGTRA